MKPVLVLFTTSLLLLQGCRKEHIMPSSLDKIKSALRDSLGGARFSQLDFQTVVQYKVDSVGMNILRIAYINKDYRTDFILLNIMDQELITEGSIVQFKSMEAESDQGSRSGSPVAITIKHLSGQIKRNIISHPRLRGSSSHLWEKRPGVQVVPAQPEYKVLPEVIVVGYSTRDGGGSRDWMSVTDFFQGGGGGGNSGGSGGGSGGTGAYYVPQNYPDGRDSEGGGGSFRPGQGRDDEEVVKDDEVIYIDFETQQGNPAIDLETYLKCFDAIPDAGSICSIELFADIPVDDDPSMLFDVGTLTPGHAFINLTKQNGNNRVSQYLGWYPASPVKPLLTTAPIPGKFVDNAHHEFNASFKVNLSSFQLKNILSYIRQLAGKISYDINDYNCTNFALDVFNSFRPSPLIIPLFDIPGDNSRVKSKTPNGLFFKLFEMKNSNHPEAKNITSNIIEGFAGSSSGACK